MNIAVIIPSYNSNSSLDELIDLINRENNLSIIVIDDGSKDPFRSTLENVEVLRNRQNRGKGFSLRKAFKHAEEQSFTHAVTLDADLQHNPKEIHLFIGASNKIDFVLGYRERDHSMPIHRKLSNIITTYIISSLTGNNILDSQCGFRRYNLKTVNSSSYKEDGFQFESEVLIRCVERNTSIEQIKIETIYDSNNKSYIKHVSDTLKFIRLILRSLIKQ